APACTEPSAYGSGVTGGVAAAGLPVGVAEPAAAWLEFVECVAAGAGAGPAGPARETAGTAAARASAPAPMTDNSTAEAVASGALFAIVSLFPRVLASDAK